MTIELQLKDLAPFAPLEQLQSTTRLPIAYAPEAVRYVLPSIVMGSDGPTLARLLLVTQQFLCDVWLGDGRHNFDYIAINTIKNYRFSLWTHIVKEQEVVKASYEIAAIKLVHGGISSSFATALDYAGDKRDLWIRNVLEALPVATVGATAPG